MQFSIKLKYILSCINSSPNNNLLTLDIFYSYENEAFYGLNIDMHPS